MRTLSMDPEVENILDHSEMTQRFAASTPETSHKFRKRLEAGYLVSPYHGIYARRAYWQSLSPPQAHMHLVRTLAVAHPNWVFSYSTAALILGLDVSYKLLSTIHVMTSVRSHLRNCSNIRRHFMHENLVEETTSVEGIATTTACRTVFDCARFFAFEDSLGIVDSGLRNTTLSIGELLAFCDGKKRFTGVSQAKTTISYGDPLSENGGESMARAHMIAMGFAVPLLQKEFTDLLSGQRYRVDYTWPRLNDTTLLGEYHGLQKYLDPQMTQGRTVTEIISAESKRRSHLSAYRTEMIDFDYKDVMNRQFFFRLLSAYGVPRRPGAIIGRPEFNRSLTLT